MHATHDLNSPAGPPITFDAFLAVDIRLGTIVNAEPIPAGAVVLFKPDQPVPDGSRLF
jgi:hypothetical protein